MANKRSRKRRPSQATRRERSQAAQRETLEEKPTRVARPPRPHRTLLLISGIAMVGWILLLLVIALSVDY